MITNATIRPRGYPSPTKNHAGPLAIPSDINSSAAVSIETGRNLMRRLAICSAALVILTAASLAQSEKGEQQGDQKGEQWITREVRHQLVMLPYYSVFDNLAYKVNGDTVTLMGEVVRPTLKDDAGRVVKRIEGVDKVINNIEVLPLSPNDDRIRRAVYRAIYSKPGLDQYAMRAVPTIHIIVKNGHVTLEGAVAREMDKQQAGMAANGVSGVFSVTNNLRVDTENAK
jgi:hyperosmotically inducible periplasmic protein